jgi:hypothetical protein
MNWGLDVKDGPIAVTIGWPAWFFRNIAICPPPDHTQYLRAFLANLFNTLRFRGRDGLCSNRDLLEKDNF